MIKNSKKQIIFSAMIILLSSLIITIPRYDYNLLNFVVANSEVSFYTTTKNDFLGHNITKIDIGNGEIIKCQSHIAKNTASKLNNIAGISFAFDGTSEDIENFLQKVDAVIIKCENVDNHITTYLAFSRKINNSINIDNKKINLQIAQVDNKITIGSPLILGEY